MAKWEFQLCKVIKGRRFLKAVGLSQDVIDRYLLEHSQNIWNKY